MSDSRSQVLPSPDNRAGDRSAAAVGMRDRLEYWGLRGLIAALRCLSLDGAARFGGAAWLLVAPYLSRHQRADRHLASMLPDLSAEQRRKILREMWHNLGQTFVEALMLDRIAAEPERIEMDAGCQTILQRTMAEGGIIVCLHLGNWEASVLPLAAAGARHVAVYRRMRNVLLEDHMLSLRAAYYKGGLLAKGDAAARGLLRQARAGGSLGVMADLRDSSDYMVTFFGRPAPSTPLPAMLARQFGRPIFAVGLVRTGPARFRMVAAEITVPRTDDRAVDIQAATQAIQAMFESWVRLWPGQWMWAHRRYN